MANLIVVCGPQAVGKMVVAESLRDKLKYNMMMNHLLPYHTKTKIENFRLML